METTKNCSDIVSDDAPANVETTGEFNLLCNQLLEYQCACSAWQGAYATEVDRNLLLCTEIEQLRALVNAQQMRIACVTHENQRLNLLMGHLMPRDIGPTTTYQSTDVELTTDGTAEEKGSHEPEKSEIVQKLETIVELSDKSSRSSTPKSEPKQS